MMKLLALDTSTEYLTLAVLHGERLLARETLAQQRHSQLIMPQIRELLAEAGLALRELDAIAYGEGPGSFTGLRIGCGVAQGLAFGAGLPVIGVSTLLALASGAQHAHVIACLDARMGEVYLAAYRRENNCWQEVLAPGLHAPGAAPALAGNDWHGVGSGWIAYREALLARYAGQVGSIEDRPPHARDIARLAADRWPADGGRPAAAAAPVYVRNKVALKTNER